MRRLLAGAYFVAALGFGLAPAAGKAGHCDVYAFGDSLSDVGERSAYSLYEQSGRIEPPSPPYAAGRYSNGRVWVEYLKRYICRRGALVSYAASGAFTDTRNNFALIAPDAGGLATQVDRVDDDDIAFRKKDVILLWAGANDYIFDTLAGSPPDPSVIVANIADAISRLAARGATRFVLPNMPLLGNTPLAATDPTGALSAALNGLSAFHNAALAALIADLEETSLDAIPVDVASLFDAVLTDPAAFGFDNVSVPCLIQQPDFTRIPTGACPADGDTFDARGVFFWDLLHPTTAVHRLIATSAFGAIGDEDRRFRKRHHRHHRRHRHHRHDGWKGNGNWVGRAE